MAAGAAYAQPQEGERPERPDMAKMKAERMKMELSLTDKQYKKVLKVYQSEEESMHPSNSGGGMPGGMMGGGPGGMPGGMGGPGGGMPGGGPGGMGGGMPGGGMGGPGGMMGGPQGERPQGPPPGMTELSDDELAKVLAKKEKKLKKILTPDQFDRWAQTHPEEFDIAYRNLGGPDGDHR